MNWSSRPKGFRVPEAVPIPWVVRVTMNDMPITTQKDWELGVLLVMDNLPSWRRRGTITWGGNPNLTWCIDGEAGLCGLYANQLWPLGDENTVEIT
ncbi:hypothetical protein F4782DRAFT_497140 [Xylaria castorea]|nr:hypothetical protein F4782DRAFT_497140 [Xylaria castorea]